MTDNQQQRAKWAEHVTFIPLGADCIIVAVDGVPTVEVDVEVSLIDGYRPAIQPYQYTEGEEEPPKMTPQEVIDTYFDGDETEFVNIAGRAYAAMVSGLWRHSSQRAS